MSLADILSTARSGLEAAQAGLRTASTNVANVATPGYARQKVSLAPTVTAGRVTGVSVGEPERVADRFLEATVWRRAGEAGQGDTRATLLDRLQAMLGTPGSPASLPGRLNALTASTIQMAAVVDSPETVRAFLADAADAIEGMKAARADTVSLAADTETEISHVTGQINTLLARIHSLNGDVAKAVGIGRGGSGAADLRGAALAELGDLIQITTHAQPDGRITIDAADGTVLLDRRLRALTAPAGSGGALETRLPPITLRFADDSDGAALLTGSSLSGGAVGGRIGALMALRNQDLPAFASGLGALFEGMAGAINAVSNAATAAPAPPVLTGRPSGLAASDRLGVQGMIRVARVDSAGLVTDSATINLSTVATLSDAVIAINGALGGAVTASLDARGALSLSASAGGGVVIAPGAPPASRAGTGFAQLMGLNDVIIAPGQPLTAHGFIAADAHGFGAGESAELALVDAQGRELARHVVTGSGGPAFADLLSELNAGELGDYGQFSLDSRGRLGFTASGASGLTLALGSDSTNRLGTGASFGALMGLGTGTLLTEAKVNPRLAGDPRRVPLASLADPATVGTVAVSRGDIGAANGYAAALSSLTWTSGSAASIERIAAELVGGLGAAAAAARERADAAAARRDDAVQRRDAFAGVNLDEELAQMVVLQNSYAAAARIMSTADDMYQALLAMAA